jgi:prolipoprotein diacylglyceryltransferase
MYPIDLFPVATTRFHPTFAYEIIWNLFAAGLLLWISHHYKDKIKPGTIFAGWLVLAGSGRFWIEFFRPDQPKIAALGLSYSALIAALMAVTGVVMLLARYGKIHLKVADNWEEQYQTDEPVQETVEKVAEINQPAKKESLIQKKAREKITAREARKQSTGTTGENKS